MDAILGDALHRFSVPGQREPGQPHFLEGHPLFDHHTSPLVRLAQWLREPTNLPTAAILFFLLFWGLRFTVRGIFTLIDYFEERWSPKPEFMGQDRVLLAPFHKQDFWEAEYSEERGPFEWYASPEQLHTLLAKHIRSTDRVLYVGCGTSVLGRYLRDRLGVRAVIGSDSCAAALMNSRTDDLEMAVGSGAAAVELVRADATLLAFRDASFDVVIDKGCLDSVACCSMRGEDNAVSLLLEAQRVLRPGGVLLLITTLDFESSQRYINPGTKGMRFESHHELPTVHPEWEGRRRNEAYVFRRLTEAVF